MTNGEVFSICIYMQATSTKFPSSSMKSQKIEVIYGVWENRFILTYSTVLISSRKETEGKERHYLGVKHEPH